MHFVTWVKDNLLKNSLAVKKDAALFKNGQCEKVVKSKAWPRNGCDGISWWQNFTNNNSGQFVLPHPSFTKKSAQNSPELLSRHTVVCRAAQENRACANGVSILTGITKSRFSRICSSVMAYPNGTKFTAELASMKFQILTRSLKLFLKYESAKFHKNFCFFSSCHFAHFAKITITRVWMLRSCWNLAHVLGI